MSNNFDYKRGQNITPEILRSYGFLPDGSWPLWDNYLSHDIQVLLGKDINESGERKILDIQPRPVDR